MITASILSIGDELLLGRWVDTNASHIARWLTDHGFTLNGVRIVGDVTADIAQAVGDVSAESRLVCITGGLGPTMDDVTREALAQAAGVELHEPVAAWDAVCAYYRQVKKDGPVPESNRRQALLPQGAEMVPNDRGTAPGILQQCGSCWILAMPGVPHEMMAMLDRFAGQIPKLFPGVTVPDVGECWIGGMGESAAQDDLADLLEHPKLSIGITANDHGYLTVRVRGQRSAVDEQLARIQQRIPNHVLPCKGLAASVAQVLSQRGQTITTAESCTCGLLMATIGRIPGVSAIVKQAMVTYHNDSKVELLGVDTDILTEHGAVSRECAEAMARGARAAAASSVAIATTGIAGPDGGTPDKPVGTVWIAIADETRVVARPLALRGDRQRIQRRTVAAALWLAWEFLHPESH